ncbi:hypothetical protein GCM10010873_38560 [Cypionkella aquatica]|uniref:Uncharacterized protein n=1 Tax=Cypionkella aquatica TaxID=1756042 RepID=A0AA37TWD8_9RHOB|nr:hypothetical protein [Cypionkella aquatica]GLS88882.1 hypothetical protein GCM10010873_38560 [Cypionkella aquatica]
MSGFGYQPKPINLMNQKLTLSPEVQAMIAEIEAKMAARAWMEAMLSPKWELLVPMFQTGLRPPAAGPVPGAAPAWAVPGPAPTPPALPNPGPAVPHAGEAKDVLDAVYKLEIVQRQVGIVQAEAKRQWGVFKGEWKAAPTGEKAIIVTSSVVVAAGMLGPILAVRDTRQMAFGLIKDKWLPVPGLDGYKIKLLDQGAGVTVPLPVRGLTVEAESSFLSAGAKPTTVMFQFDLMEFWKKK